MSRTRKRRSQKRKQKLSQLPRPEMVGGPEVLPRPEMAGGPEVLPRPEMVGGPEMVPGLEAGGEIPSPLGPGPHIHLR